MWLPILFIRLYVVMGFVVTAIAAWLYNAVADRLGVIETHARRGRQAGEYT